MLRSHLRLTESQGGWVPIGGPPGRARSRRRLQRARQRPRRAIRLHELHRGLISTSEDSHRYVGAQPPEQAIGSSHELLTTEFRLVRNRTQAVFVTIKSESADD